MKNLEQYLSFFAQNAKTFACNSPQRLNANREKAFKFLSSESANLNPIDHTSPKRHINHIDNIIAPDFGINVGNVNSTSDDLNTLRRHLPTYTPLVVDSLNGTYFISRSLRESNIATTIRDTPTADIATLDNADVSFVTQFNSLFATDALIISLDTDNATSRPIQINNILAAAANIATFGKIYINVGNNVDARIILYHSSPDNLHQLLNSLSVEIIVESNATLQFFDINATTNNVARLSQTTVHVNGQNSRCDIFPISLQSGDTLNNYVVDIYRDDNVVNINGLVLADKESRVANSTYLRHIGSHCRSKQDIRYIINDKSRCSFFGEIDVKAHALATEAFQNNNNILLSPDARMSTEPQLIIHTDDISCGHGATTGQLDQNALFYMRQRGIPTDIAKVMLTQAFASPAIEAISIDALKENLRLNIERRLYNQSTQPCQSCSMACNTLNNTSQS